MGIFANYVCSVQYINFPNFSPHFIQIVLPFTSYQYDDQSLVKRLYMTFGLPVEFSTIPGHFMWYHGVKDMFETENFTSYCLKRKTLSNNHPNINN